jgi:uncharacterized membrane protein YdjX (TVP38/TMEM64 family)
LKEKAMDFKSRKSIRSKLKNKRNLKRLMIFLPLIALIFIAGRLIDVDRYLNVVQQWIWGLGPWGGIFFIFIYVGATLLLLPGTPFTLLAAFLFGSLWGYMIMVAATTLAATSAFLIARYGARNRVEEMLSQAGTLQKLLEMVEENPFISIIFVRIAPFFPFGINNYALGLTKIPFWSYLLYSELVFIPMNAVLVLGAFAIYRAMIRGEISWVLISTTAAAGVLVLFLARAAKRTFENPKSAQKPASLRG